ncbi:Allantoicase [Coemansia erecta]|uniref:Allantoicase n=1 Tax=Coemansia erecta TaxID=147472 RepID=A0A9W7XT62_9FUNG|nr:Allantoicase [Coemansia erecta]
MGNTQSNLPTYYNADPTNESYEHSLSSYVDLASEAIGARVVRASNEHFGAAANLIKAEDPAASATKRKSPEESADAWVTRRHNPEIDWAVIQLGAAGTIAGFNIDTRGLDGEQASQVSVQGCLAPEDSVVDENGNIDGAQWEELLPVVDIASNARHLLALWNTTESAFNFVRLTLHPDGGISRLRIMGTVMAKADVEGEIDLASVVSGARVIQASNDKLGAKDNLILPNRASAESPSTLGWKTSRSHLSDHSDWAIIKLGEPGFLTRIELDTGLYDGDQPVAAALQACYTEAANPEKDPQCFWYQIVPRTELNGSEVHSIDVTLNDVPFSHIKLTIHPDGGVSRLRAYGQRVKEIEEEAAREEAEAAAEAALAAEVGLDADTPATTSDADDTATVGVAEGISMRARGKDTVEVVITKSVAEVKSDEKASVPANSPKRGASKKNAPAAAVSTPPRKKGRSKKHVNASEANASNDDEHFSSREGELIQSLTSPVQPKKRGHAKVRPGDDTDEGSVNTVDSQPKRSRRKASKARH